MNVSSFLTAALIGLVFVSTCTAEEIDKTKLKAQLIKHEGKRSKVYKDSEGVPTIGVGFNLKRSDAKAKIEALGLDYTKVLSGDQELTDPKLTRCLWPIWM